MSSTHMFSRILASNPIRARGQVIVIVAILAMLLVALIGLAVDKSFVESTHQEMQRAADAGALAAARLVVSEIGLGNDYAQSRLAAIAVVRANDVAGESIELQANDGNDPAGDIVVGYWDQPSDTFIPDLSGPNAVRVRVRRSESSPGGPLSLIFGPAFGTQSVELGAVATAVVGGPAGPVVLVLDPWGAGALRLNGTALLDAPRGLVQVNSNNHCAVQLVGTCSIVASKVAAVGGICAAEGLISGVVQPGAPVCADPLCELLPNDSAWVSLAQSLGQPLGEHGAIETSGAYGPGSYPGGLSLTAQASVTLAPGLYLLGAPGLDLQGGSTLSGQNVALLIDDGGAVDIRGNANAAWTAPTEGPLAGVALFTHRDNTGLAATIGGDGVVSIGGTVYVPSGQLRLAGGPEKSVGSLIVHRLENAGTPCLAVTGPALQQPEPVTYLVE